MHIFHCHFIGIPPNFQTNPNGCVWKCGTRQFRWIGYHFPSLKLPHIINFFPLGIPACRTEMSFWTQDWISDLMLVVAITRWGESPKYDLGKNIWNSREKIFFSNPFPHHQQMENPRAINLSPKPWHKKMQHKPATMIRTYGWYLPLRKATSKWKSCGLPQKMIYKRRTFHMITYERRYTWSLTRIPQKY
jgi:hypothetical protein